jgi:hypothetical protein
MRHNSNFTPNFTLPAEQTMLNDKGLAHQQVGVHHRIPAALETRLETSTDQSTTS